MAESGDEGIVQPRPLNGKRLNARTPVEQRAQQRFGAAFGKLEHPVVTFTSRPRRNGGPPFAIAGASSASYTTPA